MKYLYNFKKGLASKPLLVSPTDITNLMDDPNKDYYKSIFRYTSDHQKILDEKGSLAGIKDVKTDILYFDFDNKDNIDQARKDAIEVVYRLLEATALEDSIECFFSGAKGFGVLVKLDNEITPDQFKYAINFFAKDLKTFDPVVCDPQRVIRYVNTKHNKSGLYKIPLELFELDELSVDEIKELAKMPRHGILVKECVSAYSNMILPEQKPSETIKNTINVNEDSEYSMDVKTCDLKIKPNNFDDARWLLNNGFFAEGERSTALLCLASFYKSIGYAKEQTYRLLKGTAELQSKRSGQDRFPDVELWNNVVSQVYGPNWKGGIFSYKDPNSWLYKYAIKHGINVNQVTSVMKFEDIEAQFRDFVINIDKNTVKTGIRQLDETMPLTIGMACGLVGAASSGKCHGKDTPIRMFDGSVKMVQDIKFGDQIMGDDSTPRNVLGTTQGRSKLYRIDQENGDSYVVNDVHILSLKTNENRGKHQKGDIVDIEIGDYLDKANNFHRLFKGYKVPVEYTEKELPIDPYFLGLWLGDGTSSKPEITTTDKEISDYCIQFCKKYNLEWKPQSQNKLDGITFRIGGTRQEQKPYLTDVLNKYDLFNNKHIPKDFLINSRTNRLKLLAGIIDTDGHCNKNINNGLKCHYEIIQKRKELAEQIIELARSLGFKCSMSLEKKTWTYQDVKKEGMYYRIYLNGNNLHEIPVLLERKKVEYSQKNKDISIGRIYPVDIGEGDYYGFEIDGNHRYLLGDFTVTHNTSVALDILNNTSKMGVTSVFASLDMYRTRIFEKLTYRVTGGKTRKEIYEAFQQGKHKEITDKIKEQFGNVYFYDRSSPTVQNIKDYVIDVQHKTGEKVKLVMIDYFERVSSEMSDDTAASKQVAGEIQDLVNDLNVCVVVLFQPNKQALSGGPEMPILNYASIKGSSFVFQSLRTIFSIWRPFFTPLTKENDRYLSLGILKNDLGTLDTFDFGWEGKTGRIYELEDFQRNELKELLDQRDRKKKEKDDEWK